MSDGNVVYLDTETTGLYPRLDEIVEIAIVAGDGAVLLDTLVRPVHNSEWAEAENIHGIATEDVAQAPTLAELSPTIASLVEGKLVVIYNAQFDMGFLEAELDKTEGIACCMLAWADHVGEWDEYHRGNRWHRLTSAAYDVRHVWPESGAHRALADAMACRAVWRYLMEPEERARVEQIVEQEQAEDEAQHLLSQAASRDVWRDREHEQRMSRWWFAWWLRCEAPAARHRRYWDEHIKLADEYALSLYGATNRVLAEIDRAEVLGLRRYASRRDIPPYAKTKNALKTQERPGYEPPAIGYYLAQGGRRFSLLYDGRRNRWRKSLPEFWYGKIPEGYVTAHQLRTRYKLSPKQIARKRVTGRWRKPYSRGEWTNLYAPPRPGTKESSPC